MRPKNTYIIKRENARKSKIIESDEGLAFYIAGMHHQALKWLKAMDNVSIAHLKTMEEKHGREQGSRATEGRGTEGRPY